jgi:hypothetical protein
MKHKVNHPLQTQSTALLTVFFVRYAYATHFILGAQQQQPALGQDAQP